MEAVPVADPSTRFTVQEPREPDPLDHVVLKASVGDPTGIKLVDLLTPDLERSVSFQLRESFGQCLWKPSVDKDGHPREGSFTLLFHTAN